MRLRPAIIGMLLSMSSMPARADMARARQLAAQLEFQQAIAELEDELRAGQLDQVELADLFLLRGRLLAGLGQGQAAESDFRNLLILRPNATLPVGDSPKRMQPFGAAQAWARERGPLHYKLELKAETLDILLLNDPSQLVMGARMQTEGGRVQEAQAIEGRIHFAMPDDGHLALQLVDAFGNLVAPIDSATTRLAASTSGSSGIRSWRLWGGLSLGVLGTGLVFTLLQTDAQDDYQLAVDKARSQPFAVDYSTVRGHQERADRYQVSSLVCYSAAVLTTALAGYFLVMEPSSSERSLEIQPWLQTKGGGASVLMSF